MTVASPISDDKGVENSMIKSLDHRAIAKRMLDLVFSLVLLIPALPLMFLAMLMVKITSRGPAIYTQVRVGLNGRSFVIYKIRTMRNDCEKLTGPRWAELGRDPRVTRVGNFLRKTHIDELPQLYNVLRGDMTLIGPRPERPEFVAQLEQVIPHYRLRLCVRPGVTGLAQVLLPPDVDFHSVRVKLMYDLYYLQAGNLWVDLKIIACTALKVFGIPRAISRKLLNVPSEEVIETAYLALNTKSQPTTASQADAVVVSRAEVEMQPAF